MAKSALEKIRLRSDQVGVLKQLCTTDSFDPADGAPNAQARLALLLKGVMFGVPFNEGVLSKFPELKI